MESEEEEDEDGGEGEERKGVRNGGPPKRKLEMSEYPDFMAKRFANFEPYRNSTLQKWYDKTRLTMGKTTKVNTISFASVTDVITCIVINNLNYLLPFTFV